LPEFIELVAQAEGGLEFLINLAAGLRDGSIDDSVFDMFRAEIISRLAPLLAIAGKDASDFRKTMNDVVFRPSVDADGNPVSFQYVRRLRSDTHGDVHTFVTWQKLWNLVPDPSPLAEEIRNLVDPAVFSSSDPRPDSSSEMKDVAAAVNALGPKTVDFRISHVSGTGDPFPLWITTTQDFDQLAVSDPARLATRARDWLGLGHMKHRMPLFAFKSKAALSRLETSDKVGRPTIFDGTDNGYFKHELSCDCPHLWGRTMDFERAFAGDVDCDGGPEAITPGPLFGETFECRFVGHVLSAPMPTKPFVLSALLGQPTDVAATEVAVDAIKQQILDAIGARP
jgi:hypothetical protein